jgi:hypothetical protein
MSIEKKSLISTLKATKKANVVKEGLGATTTTSVKSPSLVLTGTKMKTPSKKGVVTSAKASSLTVKW